MQKILCTAGLFFLAPVAIPATYAQQSAPPAIGIPILTYHRFDLKAAAPTTVLLSTFEAQLAYLSAHGYEVVPLTVVTDMLLRKTFALPRLPVAIAVDDGHRSVYTVLFPLIQQKRIPITLFIYPSAISNASYALTWDQLREMKDSGLVDVQSHTYWHPNFRTEKARRSATDYASFVDIQMRRSRSKLDSELGTNVDLLAWPYGIVDAQLEAAAKAAGYRAAFGYDGYVARPGQDAFAIHRIPVPDSARGATFGALLLGTAAHRKEALNGTQE